MTTFSDKNDLLMDLWTSKPSMGHQAVGWQSSFAAQPRQSLLWSARPQMPVQQAQPQQNLLVSMNRDASLDYAVLLLPNNLLQNDALPQLTEENLKLTSSYGQTYHSSNSSFSEPDDLFSLDKLSPRTQSVGSHTSGHGHGAHDSLIGSNSSSSVHISMPDASHNIVPSSNDAKLQQPPTKAKKSRSTTNTQLYKTELCALYMKMGVCPYGSKCQFAHGDHELKQIERPPKWRSKPCANWAKFGACRYGNRCCFKHE